MKETLELRINYDYASLLFKTDEGKKAGTSIKVVEISKNDPRYDQIPIIAKQLAQKYNKTFFFGWEIKRKYSKKELSTATLLHMKIKNTFEPAGEECGTLYDESISCEMCGANRIQISSLMLKKGTIPKKDIARTISGEIVVSGKFVAALKKRGLKGALLESVLFSKETSTYFQLIALEKVGLMQNTIVGINPFDLSTSNEGEIYLCPNGDTIGLNLLSEPYIQNNPSIYTNDIFVSKQTIGIKRGLLRPEPIYLCSSAFRIMIEEENLSGFDFEIAHIL
jgi:hypothetical protein